jgi:hypothetical protein
MLKANQLHEIRNSFKSNPLQIEELEEFYINNEKVRGGQPVRRRLTNLFLNNNDIYI